MNTLRLPWFRKLAFIAIGIALLALVWNYSPRVPVLRERNSPWIPLAISPDGETLAVADSTLSDGWWTHKPGGPIRMLRTTDLAPVGPLIEVPTVASSPGGEAWYPSLEAVEFSPDGKLLAVLQGPVPEHNMLRLHLIRLPGGEVWKSFPIPYIYADWNKRGGFARRFFSSDGRLLAWREVSEDKVRRDRNHKVRPDRHHIVRVWDVTEERERFAVEGVTYPVLSPNGNILAAIEPGVGCRLYDTQTGQAVRTLPMTDYYPGWQPWPEFSPDGKLLVVSRTSSTSAGPSLAVFEVETGWSVFQAGESLPYFVDGPTLVSVKRDSVLFRETDTWKVQARAKFSLGVYGDGKTPVSPQPHPVPGRGAVLVYNVDQAGGASWIDAASGAKTRFWPFGLALPTTLHDLFGFGKRASFVMAPDGNRLVAKWSAIRVWELPPKRSWVPIFVAAGLLAFVCARWTMSRRRIAARDRPLSSDIGEKE